MTDDVPLPMHVKKSLKKALKFMEETTMSPKKSTTDVSYCYQLHYGFQSSYQAQSGNPKDPAEG